MKGQGWDHGHWKWGTAKDLAYSELRVQSLCSYPYCIIAGLVTKCWVYKKPICYVGFFLTGQRAAFYMLLIESFFQKINVKNLRPCQGSTCWSVKAVYCQNSVSILLFSRDAWQVHYPGLTSVQQIPSFPPFCFVIFCNIMWNTAAQCWVFSWCWGAFFPRPLKIAIPNNQCKHHSIGEACHLSLIK